MCLIVYSICDIFVTCSPWWELMNSAEEIECCLPAHDSETPCSGWHRKQSIIGRCQSPQGCGSSSRSMSSLGLLFRVSRFTAMEWNGKIYSSPSIRGEVTNSWRNSSEVRSSLLAVFTSKSEGERPSERRSRVPPFTHQMFMTKCVFQNHKARRISNRELRMARESGNSENQPERDRKSVANSFLHCTKGTNEVSMNTIQRHQQTNDILRRRFLRDSSRFSSFSHLLNGLVFYRYYLLRRPRYWYSDQISVFRKQTYNWLCFLITKQTATILIDLH